MKRTLSWDKWFSRKSHPKILKFNILFVTLSTLYLIQLWRWYHNHRQSWQLDESRTCSLTCLQQSTALPVGLTWQFLRTPLLERIALYLIESSTMCPRHTQPPHLACCPPGVMNQQSQYYLPIQGYNPINEDNVVSNPSMIRKRNSPWLKKGCLTVAKQANPRRMAVKFSVRTIAIVALEKYKLEYSH